LPPYRWKHGFIYNNDQWTSLSYPNSKIETTLQDICNGNLIVATTNQGNTALNSYIYVNGTVFLRRFKLPAQAGSQMELSLSAYRPFDVRISGFPTILKLMAISAFSVTNRTRAPKCA
jgi:hypothetical protein